MQPSQIKKIRLSKNISQSILAHASGITVNTIRLIETGEVQKPRKETIDAIEQALDKLAPRKSMGQSYSDNDNIRALLRKLKDEDDTDTLALPWQAKHTRSDPFTVGMDWVVASSTGRVVAEQVSEHNAKLIAECVNAVLS